MWDRYWKENTLNITSDLKQGHDLGINGKVNDREIHNVTIIFKDPCGNVVTKTDATVPNRSTGPDSFINTRSVKADSNWYFSGKYTATSSHNGKTLASTSGSYSGKGPFISSPSDPKCSEPIPKSVGGATLSKIIVPMNGGLIKFSKSGTFNGFSYQAIGQFVYKLDSGNKITSGKGEAIIKMNSGTVNTGGPQSCSKSGTEKINFRVTGMNQNGKLTFSTTNSFPSSVTVYLKCANVAGGSFDSNKVSHPLNSLTLSIPHSIGKYYSSGWEVNVSQKANSGSSSTSGDSGTSKSCPPGYLTVTANDGSVRCIDVRVQTAPKTGSNFYDFKVDVPTFLTIKQHSGAEVPVIVTTLRGDPPVLSIDSTKFTAQGLNSGTLDKKWDQPKQGSTKIRGWINVSCDTPAGKYPISFTVSSTSGSFRSSTDTVTVIVEPNSEKCWDPLSTEDWKKQQSQQTIPKTPVTPKPSDDSVIISGKINNFNGEDKGPVTLMILAPNGNLVTLMNSNVNSDGAFTETLGGDIFDYEGTHKITATYDFQSKTVETSFDYKKGMGSKTVSVIFGKSVPEIKTGIDESTGLLIKYQEDAIITDSENKPIQFNFDKPVLLDGVKIKTQTKPLFLERHDGIENLKIAPKSEVKIKESESVLEIIEGTIKIAHQIKQCSDQGKIPVALRDGKIVFCLIKDPSGIKVGIKGTELIYSYNPTMKSSIILLKEGKISISTHETEKTVDGKIMISYIDGQLEERTFSEDMWSAANVVVSKDEEEIKRFFEEKEQFEPLKPSITESEIPFTAKFEKSTYNSRDNIIISGNIGDHKIGKITAKIYDPDLNYLKVNVGTVYNNGDFSIMIVNNQEWKSGQYWVELTGSGTPLGMYSFKYAGETKQPLPKTPLGLDSFIDPEETKQILPKIPAQKQKVPDWVKNNAKWWTQGQIEESDFKSGLSYLIKEKIISVPTQTTKSSNQEIPQWVKTQTQWWANGQISEDEYLNAVEFLVKNGIIEMQKETNDSIISQNVIGSEKIVDDKIGVSFTLPAGWKYEQLIQNDLPYTKIWFDGKTNFGDPVVWISNQGKVSNLKSSVDEFLSNEVHTIGEDFSVQHNFYAEINGYEAYLTQFTLKNSIQKTVVLFLSENNNIIRLDFEKNEKDTTSIEEIFESLKIL